MDPPAGAIDELHFHLPKIVLTDPPGQPFETNQRLGPVSAAGKLPAHTALSCLLDIQTPARAAKSPAKAAPAPAPESPLPISGNSPPCSGGRSGAAPAPWRHRCGPLGSLAQSASPTAKKPRLSAPLPPSHDPPSIESRSRDASASPTSSSPSATGYARGI